MAPVRTSILIASGLLLVLVLSRTGHAQCAGVSCSSLPKPAINFDFGAAAPKQPAPGATAPKPAPKTAFTTPVVPNDCQMVKSVDPNFRSNMPVATPDPNLGAAMRTVVVPPCPKKLD
jgi:hypothetical protein